MAARKPECGYTISDVTDLILKNPALAASWLRQADGYMQSINQNPTTFILPREHVFLTPLIEVYAHNLEGFVQYILGVRDSIEHKSEAWERVQALYRKIMGRYVQQVRRERADRAIAKAEELYGHTNFHTRLQWMANLEHAWAQRRLEYLAVYRDKTENGRLGVEEQAEILSVFWEIIDTEIYNGEVPPWN